MLTRCGIAVYQELHFILTPDRSWPHSSLVPRLHCPAFFALWKNTGREPGLLGTSHDVTYVT